MSNLPPEPSTAPDNRALLNLLRTDGIRLSDGAEAQPLAGGVSSEIYLVRDGTSAFVVKRALEKLKVADDWRADPIRNRSEQRYLRYVSSFLPEAVPRILFAEEEKGYFTMEYFGDEFTNWKTALLRGDCDPKFARKAMSLMAKIHSTSLCQPKVALDFATSQVFHQLRIDPYLLATARRHPALAPAFEEEASRLERTRECLVHGDFSPKNILVSANRLVLLDCEAAWYGDPAFDLAFFLNHLCLKGLYHAPRDVGLCELFDASVNAYFSPIVTERTGIESRSARLLLMLMLARIDGKSPVEYLPDNGKKKFVREFVMRWLPQFHGGLGEISSLWFKGIEECCTGT